MSTVCVTVDLKMKLCIGENSMAENSVGSLCEDSELGINPQVPAVVRDVLEMCSIVFAELGKGYGEYVYRNALMVECQARQIPFQVEVTIPVMYKHRHLVGTVRADLLVGDPSDPDNRVVVECKAVSTDITTATAGCKQYKNQVVRYKNLLGVAYGVLVNFPSADGDAIQSYSADTDPLAARPRKRGRTTTGR